ncbi:DUF1697 domain-containing protein [Aequorivita antarctica]|uniref:DUF1697 domain-containing protein n=1 Tax=Aequorivita antarctica TaxID=153266 RepID=A0A5C6YWL3_9FLAO|nr:DUF1697 domain-containing protein [Aequorivita antarctica]TXD71617.1 DUF1697 domain-containing protein [Aequorivita antarctica]SRX75927.1 hypothetical protein AEQU3_02925 [Aequorivita antarctica]
MQTHIALLRGINVGGHKKLKMADLKLLFEDLGFQDVVTYIQSGNVVFDAEEGEDLSGKISKEIENRFGWELPVLVKTVNEIAIILTDCPFKEEKKVEAYFMLLASPPKEEFMKAVSEISYPNEEFVLSPECVYIYFGNGYGNAKLNNNFFEKKLKVAATTRNYRTLAKLVELAEKNILK